MVVSWLNEWLPAMEEEVATPTVSGILMNFIDVPSPVRPESTTTEALAGMAVDVLALLTVIITGSAVLLARGRRDA